MELPLIIISQHSCNEARCKCCDIIISGNAIDFNTQDGIIKFIIKKNLDCCSSNIIYKLICDRCKEYYIGQTGDTLRHRMTVHRQQNNHPEYSNLKVSKHIAQCGRGFHVMPFFQLSPDSDRLQREFKESYFISRFHPTLNSS